MGWYTLALTQTDVLLIGNGFSAGPWININTRNRLHSSTARAQWGWGGGLQELQFPVKNAKVVRPLYRCWRKLITSSLFAKSKIHTSGQKLNISHKVFDEVAIAPT